MKQKIIRFIRLDFTRFLMKLFWLFPLKKKQVFFTSYEGKQFSCNPKAVYEKMLCDDNFNDFTFVWELNNPAHHSYVSSERVKCVKHNSLKYFYHILTSKYIVTNSAVTARIPVKKSQFNINTWHGGGAYKRVGYATNNTLGADLDGLNIASAQTTHFLSSSRIFTEVMIDSISLPKERFVPCGMPRNDIFFSNDEMSAARESILKQYCLDQNAFLILYAPTYRGTIGSDSFEFDMQPLYGLKEAVEENFGRTAVLMVRMHYFNQSDNINENTVSVSDYPDMQQLLAASDMLVTDYSSSMWDFGLSKKPCILYAPDLKEYDLDRGFYTPPSDWPGMLCETEAEMISAVKAFDSTEYNKKLEKYFKSTGSYDNGTATQAVLNLIRNGNVSL